MQTLTQIPFHGDVLWAVKNDDGTVVVAVKPIVKNLGLDWPAQYSRIQRDAVLSAGVVIMTTPQQRQGQEMVCLPLELVHGFLFGIEAGRVRADRRAAVIRYQKECYAVLFAHFFNQAKETVAPSVAAPPPKRVKSMPAMKMMSRAAMARQISADSGPEASIEFMIAEGIIKREWIGGGSPEQDDAQELAELFSGFCNGHNKAYGNRGLRTPLKLVAERFNTWADKRCSEDKVAHLATKYGLHVHRVSLGDPGEAPVRVVQGFSFTIHVPQYS